MEKLIERRHVYLSAHLDDAVFSCGGLMLQQARAQEPVLVVTVFSGDPGSGPYSPFAEQLHHEWNLGPEPIAARRREDRAACEKLGAQVHHLVFQDAVYRGDEKTGYRYPDVESIFASIHPADGDLPHQVANALRSMLGPSDLIYAPLAIGGHVDHQIARLAAENLAQIRRDYLDIPYWFERMNGSPVEAQALTEMKMSAYEIEMWVDASFLYASQAPLFWVDQTAMRVQIDQLIMRHDGFPLFERE